MEPLGWDFRNHQEMGQIFSWSWVQAQVAQTVEVWDRGAAQSGQHGPQYSPEVQQQREQAYDQALRDVEHEVRRAPRTKAERINTQDRIVASFARFSAAALDLEDETIRILTEDFLPVGAKLARWARQFDESLSMADIIQACRNAWTACGLQPLIGERMGLTPSILGYSLLYPYSDNYLDREDISAETKLRFSERFQDRLRGGRLPAHDYREAALWTLVRLIEEQYPRARYPQVFDCLLAIHRAQEESIAQLRSGSHYSDAEVLRMSCAKGGSSVLADACLAHGCLSAEESLFAFEWGVLLQLGDDLQDVRDDMRRGSLTLFSRAALLGSPLDALVIQLLNFSQHVAARMDHLPNGTGMLKKLLRMSWRSLIIGAVANSHEFFSPRFLEEAERWSPFRFEFLQARNERLTSRQGIYATLFEAFLEPRESNDGELPMPQNQNVLTVRRRRASGAYEVRP
jgi:hypothetical protein